MSGQSDLQLTIDEDARTLLALDTTKATGPDGIPSRLLKETARQIAPSLTQIFNKSLSCGELPDEWKLANIVPVHKKGEKSQLTNRKQRVTVLRATSSARPVLSGVPQGSILGPILFLLYPNDLLDAAEQSKIASFADDTKLFKKIDSTTDAISLQCDLSNLENWSISSGLVFDQGKCKCQCITGKKNPTKHEYKINNKSLNIFDEQHMLIAKQLNGQDENQTVNYVKSNCDQVVNYEGEQKLFFRKF
ncbi:Hypothetical predicted protein [Paramuricea clavata]|uniref:Uncharacterized protein n=1 Tax=Paramuricea clavata TaxID=317549 RepID=A0A7D9DU13_PARCT|nr:Hypothetical predicted protein [Paramuricea clavata]